MTQTVLILRLGSIGDTVVALPCFHAIAHAYADHRRILFTNTSVSSRTSSAESVLGGSGLVDEIVHYPVGGLSPRDAAALFGEVRRRRAATLIYLAERDSLGPVLRDWLFFRLAGVPQVLGAPWTADLRNCRSVPPHGELEYEAERLARAVRRRMPVDLGRAGWDLRLSATERAAAQSLLPDDGGSPLRLAVAPGTKLPAKDWGRDRWTELLTVLAGDFPQAELVLLGAAEERALCEEVAGPWQGPVINACGLLTPREAAAALGRCRLMICHDSGPMHLAATQGTVCVALFGNHNRPRKWFPYGEPHRVVYEPRGIREISVARVAEEVRAELLNEAGRLIPATAARRR